MDNHTKPLDTSGENNKVKFVLSVLNQSSKSSSWMLNEGIYSIGRLVDHEIILDDITVSRNHAQISIDKNKSLITDINSTNGIYVNKALIKDISELNSGDKIQIGKFLLLFTKV
jgi:pSer/pThr/pTyr-binding forkhead associated (FHA) protein